LKAAEARRKRTEEALKARERQQAAVAELGQRALAGTHPSVLMDRAVALVAKALNVEYCKVLQLLPDGKALRLRAGVGWKEGLVGLATVGADNDSQAGYTLHSGKPVIVKDLRTEKRFRGPTLLSDHGVVSGMSVIIQGRGRPHGATGARATSWRMFTEDDANFLRAVASIHGQSRPYGVMGAHTTGRRAFTKDDVDFLRAIANVLASAIESKRAEEALAERENLLRTIIETEPECVKLIAADGTLLEMNPAGLAMIEADSLDQVMGKPIYPLVAPEYRESFKALTESVFQGESGILEFEVVGIKGTRRWLETHAVPLRNRKDKVVALLGITRDVSERRQAQTERWASEARFASIVSMVPDAIITVDEAQRIIIFNKGAEQIFGYTASEMTGQPLDLLLPPRLVEVHRQHIRDFAAAPEATRFMEERRELIGRRKDGAEFPAEASISKLTQDGKVTFTVILRDISERKRAEETIRRQAVSPTR
jgi:PAS domain S-box-containing protein